MTLKETLRRERAQDKGKTPFPRSLFAHVGGLVRRHRLGADFTRTLRELTPESLQRLVRTFRGAPKPQYEPPLFFLATWEEYQEIKDILAAAPNPYLAYASSPEEILLSGPLFAQNPDLPGETLATRHFASLLSRGEPARPINFILKPHNF